MKIVWETVGPQLLKAAERAAEVLENLTENNPDCYGWEPPFPSETPSIAVEHLMLRLAIARAIKPADIEGTR